MYRDETLAGRNVLGGGVMAGPSLRSHKWFRELPATSDAGVLDVLVKAVIGAAIGGGAFALGSTSLAAIIWTLTAIIAAVSLSSRAARSRLGRFFSAVGVGLGWSIGVLLLTPIYLIGFSLAHLLSRLGGHDPLQLRAADAPSFWLLVDRDRRKVRHIRSLFATESVAFAPRRGLRFAWIAAGLLVAAELSLRMLGFGAPILYVAGARTGYHPAPNQRVERYGGLVMTNKYGMRRPDITLDKPAGTLRIFMVGDSTLWGGSNVDQDELYARRLEKALHEVTARPVEVLNMGVNGWGPFNKLGYLEAFGTFDADVAIICLPIEDLYRDLTLPSDMPYFLVDAPPRLALEELLGHLNWRTRIWARDPESPQNREKQAQLGIEAYVELASQLRNAGCEVFVEILPGREAGTGTVVPGHEKQAIDRLSSALEEHGFVVGFPAGLFAGRGSEDEMYRDHCHLKAAGHAYYAEYLTNRLHNDSLALPHLVGRCARSPGPREIL